LYKSLTLTRDRESSIHRHGMGCGGCHGRLLWQPALRPIAPCPETSARLVVALAGARLCARAASSTRTPSNVPGGATSPIGPRRWP
jgi:hypothetical protein